MTKRKEKRKCQKKIGHKTKEDAQRAITHTLRKHFVFHRMEAYQCSICGKWHIGRTKGISYKRFEQLRWRWKVTYFVGDLSSTSIIVKLTGVYFLHFLFSSSSCSQLIHSPTPRGLQLFLFFGLITWWSHLFITYFPIYLQIRYSLYLFLYLFVYKHMLYLH